MFFPHCSELGRTLTVCPGVSLGGGRFGVGLAKMSRVAQEKKASVLLHCMCKRDFWRCLSGSGTLEKHWKLGSGAVLCHPHENSVKLGAETDLLSRSLRTVLAAKSWRAAAGPVVLQAVSPPALLRWRVFLDSSYHGAGTGKNVACMEHKVCGIRETVGPDLGQPSRAVWSLRTLEKVPYYPPDVFFLSFSPPQMGLSMLSWRFSQV